MQKNYDDVDIQAAAYLSSLDHKQKDIAEFLGLSQPVVNRLVKKAREDGYLKEFSPEFVRTNISDQRMEEINTRIAPKTLLKKLERFAIKNNLPSIPGARLFPTPYLSMSKETFAPRTEDFGRAAAGYAAELLFQSRSGVGVSWGITVANLVTAIRLYCSRGTRQRNPVMFVPLCGEPLGSTSTHFSASTLAAELDGVLNGGRAYSRSLAPVPALIPKTFSTEEITIIRKLMGHVEAYKEIFMGTLRDNAQDEPLIDALDTILTSVGAAETTLSWGPDELGRTAGLNRADLKKLIVGDISGVLIPKPNLKDEESKELFLIQERWTGVQERHLKNCARKAKENKASGVIIATIGANKGEIVLECIKRGLVNHLLIDRDLADKLEGLLDQES